MTRLVIQPDMSSVTVESTLWVREGQRWFPFGSRNATVRPDDLGQEAGKDLAEDPQVKVPSRSSNCWAWGQFRPTSSNVACASAPPPKRRSAWLAPRSIKTSMTWHCRFWNRRRRSAHRTPLPRPPQRTAISGNPRRELDADERTSASDVAGHRQVQQRGLTDGRPWLLGSFEIVEQIGQEVAVRVEPP